jgi:outer membrane immunogenic protein
MVVLGSSSALAQFAPPPTLTADGNESNCGWSLGAAAGALAGTALLTNQQKPTSDWSGFYLGGHLGCAWGGQTWTSLDNNAFANAGDAFSFTNDSWVAGVQLGYNWQFGKWVVGLEGTYSGGDFKDETTGAGLGFNYRLTSDISDILTLTARAGYAIDPRLLGYVKAGFASAEMEVKGFADSGGATGSASASSRHNGYALGAGLEYLATNNIVLGLDYTFIALEDKDYTLTCGALCGTARLNVEPDDIHMLTGRISFKFGGRHPTYAPLK